MKHYHHRQLPFDTLQALFGGMQPRKASGESEADITVRRVSMEKANVFMKTEAEQNKVAAFGVFLCILCPVLLIFLK